MLSSTPVSSNTSTSCAPNLQEISEKIPRISEKILQYALEDLSPKFHAPDIDVLRQCRRGERLMYGSDSSEIDQVATATFESLRLVSRHFNDQMIRIIRYEGDDIVQAAVSNALSKIVNRYRRKIDTRVPREKASEELIKDIQQLLLKATFKTNTGEAFLHLGVNLMDIYTQVRDWDVFCSVLETISQQNNISTVKLEAPFLFDADNIIKNVCTFFETIVKNERNPIRTVRLNFSNNQRSHRLFRFSYLKNAFDILKERKISMKELNLGRTPFDDTDIQALFDCLHDINALECLSLRGNLSNAQSIDMLHQALKHNQGLRSLDLSHRPLDSADICTLIDLVKGRSFEYLGLQGLGADHVAALFEEISKNRSSIHIHQLDLSKSVIKTHGMQCLKELLEDNVCLDEIILRGCLFEPAENRLALIALLASALSENTAVKVLDIAENDIGLDGIVALRDALKSNTTLKKVKISSQARSVQGDPWGLANSSHTQKTLMAEEPRLVFGT